MPGSKESINKTVQFGVAKKSSSSSITGIEENTSISNEESGNNDTISRELRQFEEMIQTKYLSRLMANASLIIAQQAIEEITILRQLNNMPKVDVNLEFVPLKEKYNMAEFDLQGLINTSDEFLTFKKLQKDVGWIENVLMALVQNLKKNLYFDDLRKILNDDFISREEEKTLLESKKFFDHELDNLRFCINTERRDLTKMIHNVTQDLGNCKDQLNDSIVEIKIKLAYVQQWQKSRHEQNQMLLENKETTLKDLISNTNTEIEKENRIHEEQWLFLENSIADYKSDIELWMEKYDKDLEEKEQHVQLLDIKLDNTKEKYTNMLEEYNRRQEFITEYNNYKIEREKEAKELERRNNAAVKIQSWWRGVMFRKGLGPYRKKKGKGRGKGANGKNSGKKK